MTRPTQARVPVTHDGRTIGSAKIDDDGSVEMTLFPRNDFAKNVMRAIQEGLCDGLSIAPNLIPAMPATLKPPSFGQRDHAEYYPSQRHRNGNIVGL